MTALDSTLRTFVEPLVDNCRLDTFRRFERCERSTLRGWTCGGLRLVYPRNRRRRWEERVRHFSHKAIIVGTSGADRSVYNSGTATTPPIDHRLKRGR